MALDFVCLCDTVNGVPISSRRWRWDMLSFELPLFQRAVFLINERQGMSVC